MFVWMIVPMLFGLAESLDLDFRYPKFLEEFFQFRGSSLKCAFVYEDRELPGLLSVTPSPPTWKPAFNWSASVSVKNLLIHLTNAPDGLQHG